MLRVCGKLLQHKEAVRYLMYQTINSLEPPMISMCKGSSESFRRTLQSDIYKRSRGMVLHFANPSDRISWKMINVHCGRKVELPRKKATSSDCQHQDRLIEHRESS